VAHSLTHTGLEVEGVEAHESVSGGLKNFLIGQVNVGENKRDYVLKVERG
jgi:hypothetical protein